LHRLTATATAKLTKGTCNLRKLTALLLLLVHKILVCSVHLRLTTKLTALTLLRHSAQLLTTKLTRKLRQSTHHLLYPLHIHRRLTTLHRHTAKRLTAKLLTGLLSELLHLLLLTTLHRHTAKRLTTR
jgi:hypothetical protein